MLSSFEHALNGKAEEYVNDPSLEAAWAIKCYENARTHMSIICSCDPKLLKLSVCDDELYKGFRSAFPDMNFRFIDENDLKSEEAKVKWRNFIEGSSDLVDDYNAGYLLRLDSHGTYDSDNTIVVVKLQFLAIEAARNREGCNCALRKTYGPGSLPPE